MNFSQSFFQNELENLHLLELYFPLVLVLDSKQLNHSMTSVFIVIATQSEVRKQLFLLCLNSHLRVTEYQKIVIVHRRLSTLLRKVVTLSITQRHKHSLSLRRRLRLEESLRVGCHVHIVAKFQDYHQLFLLVDVLVQVHFVPGVEAVDQAGVSDSEPHQLLDRGFQEQFVVFHSPQSFSME